MEETWAHKRQAWFGYGALAINLFVLLATSSIDRWSLSATLAGPMKAPADRALEVVIESSHPPNIDAIYPPSLQYGAHPCASRWVAGQPLSCVLPPGTLLQSVSISDPCTDNTTCPPPKEAFVRAKTSEIPYWTSETVARAAITLPSAHGSDRIASLIEAKVDGGPFMRATLEVTRDGATVYTEDQICRASAVERTCEFLVYDSLFPGGPAPVDLVLTVTAWGACRDGAPCVPEPIQITSFEATR